MSEEKHLAAQFNAELNHVSTMIMTMGGLVEQQMRQAVEALITHDCELARAALKTEADVNRMEVDIDHELTSIISRRQPVARDLRLLIAISRTTANLERAGDEATKIARSVSSIARVGTTCPLPSNELRVAANMASDLLHNALDAFARLDVQLALEILRKDSLIDQEFDGFMRKLVTYIMEDPRTITSCLELMWVAKAVERIGDHCKNVAESVIYIVNGEDVRHISLPDIESRLLDE